MTFHNFSMRFSITKPTYLPQGIRQSLVDNFVNKDAKIDQYLYLPIVSQLHRGPQHGGGVRNVLPKVYNICEGYKWVKVGANKFSSERLIGTHDQFIALSLL